MKEEFIYILNPEQCQGNDLVIITEPTETEPGQARLDQARIGQPNPDTPNSVPVLSKTGAKIGYKAQADFMIDPSGSYWLLEPQGGQDDNGQ